MSCCLLAVGAALGTGSPALGADKRINLDGDWSNGNESKVRVRVFSTYPVDIQNVIFNEAAGKSFTFVYPSAGPGGFESYVAEGPGVGTKWRWKTHQQVFSITGSTCDDDICFEDQDGNQLGPFGVPGKSIFPTQITLSSAVLTSSLIRFFSPDEVTIEFVSEFEDGIYQNTAINNLDVPQMVRVEEPGCCEFPRMIICDDECFFYLTDPDHCGGCDIRCGPFEMCVDGVCEPDCPVGLTLCGEECVDTQVDLRHCGSCDNACGDNQICDAGACRTCRPPEQTACPVPGLPFQAECTNVHKDPTNCGACGVNCTSLACPSGGQGQCSQGTSCFCDDHPQTEDSRVASLGPPVSDDVVEAKVCEAVQFEQEIPAGGSATFCQFLPVLPKEIVTEASTLLGGFRTVGPLVQLVPDFNAVIGPVRPTSCGAHVDDGPFGDGLWQPGETADLFLCVQNRGPESFTDVTGMVSAPATPVIPSGIPFSADTSPFPDLPGFPSGEFDCDNRPPDVLSVQNLLAFTGSLPVDHPADVGHPVLLSLTGEIGGSDETGTDDLTYVIGIGAACDPVTDNDGQTYDRIFGLKNPVDVHLVPEASPVNFSSKGFGRNKTLPLKFTLGCGSEIVDAELIDPLPEIVKIENRTAGTQVPLVNINGGDNANPSDPFFVCGSSRCEYELRTKDLGLGDHVISIRMPDSRVFHAGFTLSR